MCYNGALPPPLLFQFEWVISVQLVYWRIRTSNVSPMGTGTISIKWLNSHKWMSTLLFCLFLLQIGSNRRSIFRIFHVFFYWLISSSKRFIFIFCWCPFILIVIILLKHYPRNVFVFCLICESPHDYHFTIIREVYMGFKWEDNFLFRHTTPCDILPELEGLDW